MEPMKGHMRGRIWLALAIAVVLVVGHGVILYYFSSHLALSAAAVFGVVVVLMIKHRGLLGSLYAVLGRRSQP